MNYYQIAVIPGDGIGKEIAPEGVRLLNFAAEVSGGFKIEWQEFPW
jgi:tartrate dehydrogenase/decarboxylase/D-malate dehydrogenase